ncbi:divergent polysaccharide deacetylase family protein [Myxococcota bacterium]|nr:divergent polysaccharide deacetylase family protein [Myxococcota bacterium]
MGGLLAVLLPHAWDRVFPAGGRGAEREDPATLAARVAEVDRALARALAPLGVDPRGIVETPLPPEEREGVSFRPSSVRIPLPEGADRGRIEGAIRAETGRLGFPAQVYFTDPDEVTWGVRISLGKFPTHRVTLHPPLPADPVVDPRHPPVVALLLTGVGAASPDVEAAIAWDRPLTLSIRPWEPHSIRYAGEASRAAKEVLVELPRGGAAPGGGLDEALASVPFVAGVAISEPDEALPDASAATVLVKRLEALSLPLILLDPPATSPIRAQARAGRVPLEEPAARLDPAVGDEALESAALRALNIAVRRGRALVTASADPRGIKALLDLAEGMRKKGYRFVFASEVARLGAASGPGSPPGSP